MKKIIAIALVLVMALAIVSCGQNTDTTTTTAAQVETTVATVETTADNTPATPVETIMTYDEFVAAALDSEVCVVTYIQGKQSWWDNKGTFYTQDENGGYFLYNMPCTEEEYNKLTVGTKVKVTGFKAEWSGEVEIIDAKFEILDGTYVATPVDVTSEYASETLINKQNMLVAVKGATVVGKGDENAPFFYKWNGTGDRGDDIYFDVSINGTVYTVTVESYLCDKDSETYKAVESLKVGDVIDMEGFLYWYNGSQPHITKVTAADATAAILEKAFALAEGEAMTEAVTLTGEIVNIPTAYSEQYGNITVNIQVGDKVVQCYRLVGGADLKVGDKITVTGVIKNYKGTVEFDAKCTFVMA